MAQYQIEERVLRPAPEITSTEVMSLSEAASELGVSYSTLYNYFSAGTLTVVVDTSQHTAYKRFRRYVLRRELDAFKSARADSAASAEGKKNRRANTLKLIAEARQRAQTSPLNDAEFTNRFAESRSAILEEATREGTVIEGGLDDGEQSVT